MKLLLILLMAAPASAAPKLAWQLSGFEQPESAYYEPLAKTVYVSNVSGAPDARDGKGWISTVSPQGKLLAAKWVEGLDAPKGLRACAGRLYAADIDRVVVIEIDRRRVLNRIPVPGAQMLNDIVVLDLDCTLLVSDTFAGRIYRISADAKVTVWREGAEIMSPNGLFLDGGTLYAAGWGAGVSPDWKAREDGMLLRLEPGKPPAGLAALRGNFDGLEKAGDDWLVSDWKTGAVYRLAPKKKPELLLKGFKGPADLGYSAPDKLLLVPRMGENKLSAYKL